MESLYDVCARKDLDILYLSGVSFFDTEELKEKYSAFAGGNYLRKGEYTEPLNGPDMLVRLQENKDYIMSACLQIVRREFLLEHQIAFYEGIIHEDNIFTFQTLLLAERVFCIKEVFFNRRVREDSIMTRAVSHKNLYGYFCCLLQNTAAAGKKQLTEKQRTAVILVLKNLRTQVVNIRSELPEQELDAFYERCSLYERLQFDVYLDSGAEIRRITNSATFRIGSAVLWPMRVLKNVMLRIKKALKR